MSHLQTVLQNGNELFDLTVVKYASGNASLSRETLKQVHPLRPLTVARDSHWSLIGFDGDGKLVLGDKVVGTLRETIVDFGENVILFLGVEGDRKLWQILFFRFEALIIGFIEEL
jgi:hypothetical protein